MIVFYLLCSVALLIVLTVRWNVHPFLALLLVAIMYGFGAGMSPAEIILAVNTGFGETLGKIGLVIVLGVLIGAFLENTGAAYTLAEKILQIIGRKRVPVAMNLIGYIVAIPVFGDSGFLLLAPLNKSLVKKAGLTLAGSAIALAMGLIASHTMVPPTPGPIAAAGVLGADLGLVLAVGIPVSILAALAGLIFARFYASRTWLDPGPDGEDQELVLRLKRAPSVYKSGLPIVVPIILIVLKSVVSISGMEQQGLGLCLSFVGEPVIALLIGLFLALFLPEKFDSKMLSASGWTGVALQSAAGIILITGAGGVFGKILQNSGIADFLGESLSGTNLGLWLPFLLATAIKTAQGSSTVALITTASIVLPLMPVLGLDSSMGKAVAVVAIGAGSAMVCHANDSFFWVVTQMTGMDVRTGYRLLSLGTICVGVAAMCFLYLGYLIFS
ncbi:MAG: GntP family permease [Lewinellaceae bacterium]|nr:GntP family permease [Saprospiraceae bacterium]MCB9334415.1 GntP family permease [Lewinellaceae bacterium]